VYDRKTQLSRNFRYQPRDPMMRNGMPVIEFKDAGGRTCMGIIRVGSGGATHGNLMLRVFDLGDETFVEGPFLDCDPRAGD
jgi:hypothetical protein